MNDGEIKFKVTLDSSSVEKASKNMGKTMDNVASKFKSAGKSLTKKLTVPIVGLAGAAIKMNMDFEQSFAQVSTLLDGSAKDMEKYKKTIIDASTEMGIGVDEFSESVYQAISAGVDQADAVEFVTNQTKLAKGGFTDLTTAVDTTTSILNAYGKETSEANSINEMLIKTQNRGKTTVAELGASISQVTPTAAAMGLEFQQVASSLAVMTAQGTPTAQATTQLNTLLAELGKQGTNASENLKDAASALGFTAKEAEKVTFQSLIQDGFNLEQILSAMKTTAEESGTGLIDMFGSIEAGKAAMSITSDVKGFSEALEDMRKDSGATDKAFEKVTDTAQEKFAKALNELKNSAIDLGANMMPIVTKITEGISNLASWFAGLTEGQQTALLAVLGLFAALGPLLMVIGQIVTVLKAMGVVLTFISAHPIILALIVIIGLIFILIKYFDQWKAGVKIIADAMMNLVGGIVDKWKAAINMVLGFFKNLGTAIFNVFKTVFDKVKSVFLAIWNFIQGVFSMGGKIFNGLKEGIAGVFKTIVNGLISGINFVISQPFKLINGMLNTIRNIKILKMKPFSGLWGQNPVPVPQIPKLATGTNNIKREGLAYLHQGEAVVPKKYNPAVGGMGAGGNMTLYIQQPNIELDGRMVSRGMTPYIVKTVKTGGGNV